MQLGVTAADTCDGGPVVACVDQTGSAVDPTSDTFPVGTTNVTCTATDCAANKSSCGFDVVVNDPPQITMVSLTTQTVQYSDRIAPVQIKATDCGPGPLTVSAVGVPAALSLPGAANVCVGTSPVECTFILSGTTRVPEGTHNVVMTVKDEHGVGSASAGTTIDVKAEDASIAFDGANPVAVEVVSDGGASGAFVLTARVNETLPDVAGAGADLPGDIAEAVLSITLSPIGPGGPVVGSCSPDNAPDAFSYAETLEVTCSFNAVPVNTYSIGAVLVANGAGDLFYLGGAFDVLVVYDPSLGFTTGGGHFEWPGTGDRTNFGYNMKYNRKRTRIQGSLLLMRHLPDGTSYRLKSNVVEGLAIGDGDGFDWASFSGKATYREPSWIDPVGNHGFVAYVEDHGEPGAGGDKFWIQVTDKDGAIIVDLSIQEPAAGAGGNAETLVGGNIVVPHQ